MRKFKCLLIVSLIAILALGALTACSIGGGIYIPPETNCKVVYCGNGGTIDDKVERYLYFLEDEHAPEPQSGANSPVKNAMRSGYRFVGWKVCKLDENKNPVLCDEAKSPYDGGVWVADNGTGVAIDEKDVPNYKDVVKKFYDYEDTEWVFNRDKVTVEGVALIAIWEEYHKFIVADKKDNGEWEDLDALTNDSFTFESDVYEEYADRLVDATSNNGTQIIDIVVKNAYKNARPGYTALQFFYDAECKNEIVFPISATKLVTVIYYKEIKGIFELVSDANSFISALGENKNIYLTDNINLGTYNVGSYVYSGIIEGNNRVISGGKTTVVQERCLEKDSTNNIYGGIFADLEGATIKDVTIETTVNFQIAVDPDAELSSNGTEADRDCFVGIFAKSMKNCKLSNVTVNAKYEITRSKTLVSWFDPDEGAQSGFFPNEFKVNVHFAGWQATDSSDNNIADDCSISFTEVGKQEGNTDQTPGGQEGNDEDVSDKPEGENPSQTPNPDEDNGEDDINTPDEE